MALDKLQIGNVELENNLILAPMAGVTDLPFRVLCKEQGAGLICMEMVSAKAISYNNKKTLDMMRTFEGEHPVSLQLFGNDPLLLSEVVRSIEEYPFDIIDINMGCPVPKVVKNKEGSALLKDPLLVGKIIEAMSGATAKPITAKIRTGFDEEHINASEIAHIVQESGGKAITVHGRTREQYYSGKANWEEIRRVKASVSIPVIGNGDIYTPKDAERMERETGCDGFAIARGAKGAPWIFRDMIYYEQSGQIPEAMDISKVCSVIREHGKLLVEEKGEYIGIREMRKHTAWYLAGYRHASKIRGRLNDIESLEELFSLLEIADIE